jgi:hypothetical protein
MGYVLIDTTQNASSQNAATYRCMDAMFISIVNNPAVVTYNRSGMAGRISLVPNKRPINPNLNKLCF